MDAALQRLAQVQDLGIAGQDLGKHDENIPDVCVISRLQAVNWGLDGAGKEDLIRDEHTPFKEYLTAFIKTEFSRKNKQTNKQTNKMTKKGSSL